MTINYVNYVNNSQFSHFGFVAEWLLFRVVVTSQPGCRDDFLDWTYARRAELHRLH
jgi:hypothetical protein